MGKHDFHYFDGVASWIVPQFSFRYKVLADETDRTEHHWWLTKPQRIKQN